MQLPLQDFTTLVRNMAAAVQGASRQLIDLTVGSVLRAILEANASLALWMQWLMLQVLSATRAATSVGADLDTWVGDFGLARLPASAAGGVALFSRTTPGLAAMVPVGAAVRTAVDGGATSQTYTVIADATNPAWNGSGYMMAAAAVSISLPIVAVAPGLAGNVQPGAIVLLASAIPGVDNVTNPGATAGGLDAESDGDLRARFSNYIDSRSRATATAIGFAIQSLRQGLRYAIAESQDPNGAWNPGHFTVTVDDGTGAPASLLLSQVVAAVDAVRPIGSTFTVQPPVVYRADVNLTLTIAAPASRDAVAGAVATSITAWVGGLSIGASLPLSRIVSLAFAAHPAITDVSHVSIGGFVGDLVPSPQGLVRPGAVTVS